MALRRAVDQKTKRPAITLRLSIPRKPPRNSPRVIPIEFQCELPISNRLDPIGGARLQHSVEVSGERVGNFAGMRHFPDDKHESN